MMRALSLGPLALATLLACVLACAGTARAEQFVVTDVTYTHSGDLEDSHYRVNPSASTSKNWQSPVDYSTGSVHVLLEVKTKPAGNTPTKFQICFEGTPDYACTDQSPTYTTTGTYQWTTEFSNFYYGGDVDWSQGVNKVALILKDTMNMKPQGDPKYMPTDLRVEVAVISAGASYVAPVKDAGLSLDGGAKDAGASRADAGEAGTARPAADAGNRDAGTDAGGSAEPTERDASSTSSDGDASAATNDVRDAATGGGSTTDGSDAGDEGSGGEEDDGSGGCSVGWGTRGRSQAIWTALGLGLASVRRRRRRF